MRKEDIARRLSSTEGPLRHPARFYRFAASSHLDQKELDTLRGTICRRCALSEAAFMKKLEASDARWSAKSVRQAARLAAHPLTESFARRHASDFRSRGLSPRQCKALLIRQYQMAFHALSILKGENCLKAVWIDRLEKLLNDPDGLAPSLSMIERPIVLGARGKLQPTQDPFVFHVLLNSHLLADALLIYEEGVPSPRMQIVRDVFRAARTWDEQEMAAFLRPSGFETEPQDIAVPAEAPFDELEPVIDPSRTFILSEELTPSASREILVSPSVHPEADSDGKDRPD